LKLLVPTPTVAGMPLPARSVVLPPTIVIGFVGGRIRHDDMAHSEVQLAARLHDAYPIGVHVQAFENGRGGEARKVILGLLDTDQDGSLTVIEKQNARIIIYGHSWGGSEAITVARELDKLSIPVLLTIQVDSVEKRHQNDGVIPTNVVRAANFYQIRAADPAHTSIIGNFRFDYKDTPYTCKNYPWYDRVFFVKNHTQIECDPAVWQRAEALIRSDLPAASSTAAAVAGGSAR
jgi:hypothetical protein